MNEQIEELNSTEEENEELEPELELDGEDDFDEIVCPYCSEVLAAYEESYRKNNPEGFRIWEEELLREHYSECQWA